MDVIIECHIAADVCVYTEGQKTYIAVAIQYVPEAAGCICSKVGCPSHLSKSRLNALLVVALLLHPTAFDTSHTLTAVLMCIRSVCAVDHMVMLSCMQQNIILLWLQQSIGHFVQSLVTRRLTKAMSHVHPVHHDCNAVLSATVPVEIHFKIRCILSSTLQITQTLWMLPS